MRFLHVGSLTVSTTATAVVRDFVLIKALVVRWCRSRFANALALNLDFPDTALAFGADAVRNFHKMKNILLQWV